MSLLIACPLCGAKFRTPDYAFGRIFKCPKCGKSITINAAPNQPTPVEPVSPFREPTPPDDVPVLELASPSDDIPVLELAHEEDTKACPFCAETIRAAAKKCKHCDEMIDESLDAAEKEKRAASASGRSKLRAVRGEETVTASKAALGFGNASVIFSIIGLVFSIFPCIGGIFAFPLCSLGLLLGIVGLVSALTNKPRRIASPLAGSITGLAGLGIAAMWLTIFNLSSIDHRGINETPEMIANTHKQGAEVGREEGRRAGEAEGFAASFTSAEKEAYRETIEELYQSHQFERISLYTVGVVMGFFIVGFLLQWIAFYVPRRAGYLRDIDWIVLPKDMTQVDLYDLSVPIPTESKRLKPPSTGTTLVLLLSLLPMIGCKSREEDAWQQGYDASRNAAYQEGWREGAPRGEKEGKERGKAEAEHAAQTGRAWQLYTTPAFLALMFGIIVGIAVQYTVLACCNDAGRVPELVTVAFVPAMKHSVTYTILEGRRKLLIWWEQEKSRLATANQLKAAQIQAIHDVIVRKLKVMAALEELTQARLLDLAREELSKVVSHAEQKARTTSKRAVACPHCGKTIAYPHKMAGKTVNCPYVNCGRPIYLPANTDES
jgi:hypothetical protein